MKLAELDILQVWGPAGGGPLRGKRGQAFWRAGDSYSVSLDPAKGTWYDHRDAHGGGPLALVETALGSDRRTALQWLEANCGLDHMRPGSPTEYRTYRQELDDAEHFGIAAQALAETLLEQMDASDPARFDLTRMLGIVRAGGTTLINEYQIWLDRNPQFTRAMVRAGAASETRIQRRLALYVMELANAG